MGAPSADRRYFNSADPLPHQAVEQTMARIGRYTRTLTAQALQALSGIDGLTLYGPATAEQRTPLLSFNIAGASPFAVAEALDRRGIESRAGCHCATLAHRELGLDPPASCRLSFYLYNTAEDVSRATGAVARLAGQSGIRSAVGVRLRPVAHRLGNRRGG
jgi:cysteine desulfurase / selenocysteine lyase